MHNSLSTITYTSFDTFAMVHALLDRVDGCARHPDKICNLSHFVSRTKKCRNFHSIVSAEPFWYIQQQIFFFKSHSQSIGWVKKPDNNCQTTRIVSKSFVHFFSAHRYSVSNWLLHSTEAYSSNCYLLELIENCLVINGLIICSNRSTSWLFRLIDNKTLGVKKIWL